MPAATTRPEHRRGMSRGAIRAERRRRSRARRRRKRAIWWILGGMLAMAFIASLLVPGGLTANRGRAQSRINTGGPVKLQPDDGRAHIEPGQPHAPYSTKPATSGPHWAATPGPEAPDGAPVRWGVYDHPIPDEALVHNLEHGGIGLHYNCPDGCPELVKQLRSLVPSGASQFVLSPYPDMESKIAITAWRHILHLDEFDRARIEEFISEYIDRAPESVPGNQF